MIAKILEHIQTAYDATMEFADKKPLLGAVIGVVMFRIGELISSNQYAQTIGLITMTLGCITAFFMMMKAMFSTWKEFRELREIKNDKNKTDQTP